jgi:hypothetical protein
MVLQAKAEKILWTVMFSYSEIASMSSFVPLYRVLSTAGLGEND